MSEKIVLPLLKKIRTEIGLTQDELAGMVDVTERTIQRIESGSPTSLSTAKSIASALELPSFNVMTAPSEQEQVEAEGEIAIHTITWQEKAKAWVSRLSNPGHKELLVITAFIMAMLMIPVQGIALKLVCFFMIAAPMITVGLLVTKNGNDKRQDSVVSKPNAGLLIGLFSLSLLANLSASAFALLTITQNDAVSFLSAFQQSYTGSPGPESWFSWVQSNYHLIWVVSGVLSLVSLLSIHGLIYHAKRKDFSFEHFTHAYSISLVLTMLSSLFIKTSFISGLSVDVVVKFFFLVCLIVSITYYMALRHAKKSTSLDTADKNMVLAGSTTLTLPVAISAAALLLLSRADFHYSMLKVNEEAQVNYCNAHQDERVLCWGAQTLRKHGIPVTEINLTLLNALNGKISAIKNVEIYLNLPHEVILGTQTGPESVVRFLTQAYVRSLNYHATNGSIDTLVEFNLSKNDKSLALPMVNMTWASMAMNEQERFVKDFELAPLSARKDPHLKTIYALLKGHWEKKTVLDVDYYNVGSMLFRVKDGRVVDYDKAITVDDLDLILSIPVKELPSL